MTAGNSEPSVSSHAQRSCACYQRRNTVVWVKRKGRRFEVELLYLMMFGLFVSALPHSLVSFSNDVTREICTRATEVLARSFLPQRSGDEPTLFLHGSQPKASSCPFSFNLSSVDHEFSLSYICLFAPLIFESRVCQKETVSTERIGPQNFVCWFSILMCILCSCC